MATGGIFKLIPNETPPQNNTKVPIAPQTTPNEIKSDKLTILEYLQKKNKEIQQIISEKLKKGKP